MQCRKNDSVTEEDTIAACKTALFREEEETREREEEVSPCLWFRVSQERAEERRYGKEEERGNKNTDGRMYGNEDCLSIVSRIICPEMSVRGLLSGRGPEIHSSSWVFLPG